jgi:hypothetical protein
MQKFKLTVALSAFGFAMTGAGIGTANAVFYLQCPRDLRATWSGGASGQVTDFYGPMTPSYIILPQPGTHLGCERTPEVPESISVVVQLSPGSIPALCGGRARVTGYGIVFGGVPPFGGFVFDSGRIDAIPTYSQSTGRCQLDLPLENLHMTEVVNQSCTLLDEGPIWWRCPNNTVPATAMLDHGGARFAGARPSSAGGSHVLSKYDAFASERLTIASLLSRTTATRRLPCASIQGAAH